MMFSRGSVSAPVSYMTQENRQDASGVAIAYLLLGVVGGLGLDLCAKELLAPFEYTALIGGAIAGYLIWDEVPDRWVAVGATVIIASGLLVVYRELGGTMSGRYLRAFTAGTAAALRRRLNRGADVPE